MMKFVLALLLAVPLVAEETFPLRPGWKPSPGAPAEVTEPDPKGGPTARAISLVSLPTLTVHLPAKEKATETAIIICPGGGYTQLMIDREGHQVARWLNSLGIAGIVLKYRLPVGGRPRGTLASLKQAAEDLRVPLDDAYEAVRVTRAHAARWRIRPDAVGMMGFSAGGHLAGMTGMLAPPDARPNFLALLYPAIPQGLEVTASTPPTFLAAAHNDPRLAAADHAVRFYIALKKAEVPAEMHIYASGGHGFALRKEDGTAATWPQAFATWLATLRRP
jgi:acetyl esterase/lipase